MNILAAKGRLIVEPAEAPKFSKGGISLPQNAQDQPTWGTVLESSSPQYFKGMTVFYSSFGGSRLKYKDVLYLILKEDEVLAYLNEEKQ